MTPFILKDGLGEILPLRSREQTNVTDPLNCPVSVHGKLQIALILTRYVKVRSRSDDNTVSYNDIEGKHVKKWRCGHNIHARSRIRSFRHLYS